MANKPLKTIKFPGLPDTYTIPQVDTIPTHGSINAVSSGSVYDGFASLYHTETTYDKKTITEFFTGGTRTGSSIYAPTSNSISLNNQSGYNSYYVTVAEDIEIFFDVLPNIGYFAIGRISDVTNVRDYGTALAFYGSNPVRYRTADNNIPTPTSKLLLSAGDTALITIKDSVSPDDVSFCYGDPVERPDKTLFNENIRLNTPQLTQVANYIGYTDTKCLMKYVSGSGEDDSTERVEVFVPGGSGFIKYNFVHTVVASNNSNVWRIGHAEQVDTSFNTIRAITTTGEWECAVKLDGRSDFSGGFLHGDEVVDDISFVIDGQLISDITTVTTLTEFDKLEILQSSNLYDPNDSTTIIANHYSRHLFCKEDATLQIDQTVKWLGSYTMGASYLAMFPIAKTVSGKYYTDYDFCVKNTVIPIQQTNVSETDLIGDNIMSRFIVDEYPVDTPERQLSIQDNGGGEYNKCYYIACHNGDTVASGDIWKSSVRYSFAV